MHLPVGSNVSRVAKLPMLLTLKSKEEGSNGVQRSHPLVPKVDAEDTRLGVTVRETMDWS